MKNPFPIYLDHSSSTPVDPRVAQTLYDFLMHEVGNPSSAHAHGRRVRALVERARESIAEHLGVERSEIIFTSGGTEGAALLIRGFLMPRTSAHVVSSRAEHACVDEILHDHEKRGGTVSYLPVGRLGAVAPSDVANAITERTALITVMAVNNETGVRTNLAAIAQIALHHSIPLIVDGVAWLGKAPLAMHPGISAAFFAGHKIHAPQGTGFCYCSRSLKLAPLFLGGHQERRRRAGTENAGGIVALAHAVALLNEGDSMHAVRTLREHFEARLCAELDGVSVNGEEERASHVSNLSFSGIDGETLLILLDQRGVSASHGSACSSGSLEPSRVLLAMDYPIARVRSSLRFSFARSLSFQEVDQAASCVISAVRELRA